MDIFHCYGHVYTYCHFAHTWTFEFVYSLVEPYITSICSPFQCSADTLERRFFYMQRRHWMRSAFGGGMRLFQYQQMAKARWLAEYKALQLVSNNKLRSLASFDFGVVCINSTSPYRQAFFKAIMNEEFYSLLTGLIYCTCEYSTILSTRWRQRQRKLRILESMLSVASWFRQHRQSMQAYLNEKKPPCAPPT